MTAITDVRGPWAEFGRLAERAAMAVDEAEIASVDHSLAVALAALARRPVPADVDRLAAAARDASRPLHRRVAAVAALHLALRPFRRPSGAITAGEVP
jgi:anti-sigma factor RsiW